MRKCHVMRWLSFGKKQLNPDFTPRSGWTSKTLVVLPYLRDVRFASAVLWSNRSFKKRLFTAFMSDTHFKHRWLTVFKPKYFFKTCCFCKAFFFYVYIQLFKYVSKLEASFVLQSIWQTTLNKCIEMLAHVFKSKSVIFLHIYSSGEKNVDETSSNFGDFFSTVFAS